MYCDSFIIHKCFCLQNKFVVIRYISFFLQNNMSSSESSDDMDRWQSVFAAVTDSELRFYESAPWSGEAWRAPAEAYSLIATRLVGSGRRAELPEFSIRCATVDGVITHHLRAETHRDLAEWAKALVNGSHASAVTQRELVCSMYLCQYSFYFLFIFNANAKNTIIGFFILFLIYLF